jgi:4-hydroxy-2-oxoheptanedioate aldolase
MRENTIRTIWQRGDAVINGWLSIPSGVSAESMSHQGFDSLTVDMQHGLIDYQTMLGMLQAISTTATIPTVRVPWLEPGIIMKSLDAGAMGIICPMINTRAECEQLVSYCRYWPKGYRSFGPTRAILYAGADYAQRANDSVLAIAMIETLVALDNLEDILATPGLDGIYIGPADLGLSLGGIPKMDQTEPKIYDAIKRILQACRARRIPAGIHCLTTEYAQKMVDLGFQLVTLATDLRMLAMYAGKAVGEMRSSPAAPQIRGSVRGKKTGKAGAAGPY